MAKTRTDDLAASVMRPLLRAVGFKMRKHEWNRARGAFIDVIDVQLGKGSDVDSEQFTLNVGVFIPELYVVIWGHAAPAFAREVDCVVRSRIGSLLRQPAGDQTADKWWTLDSSKSDETVRSEVTDALHGCALPFLDRFHRLDDVRDFLVAQHGWRADYPLTRLYLAALCEKLGDREECAHILEDIKGGQNGAWAERASVVETRLSQLWR